MPWNPATGMFEAAPGAYRTTDVGGFSNKNTTRGMTNRFTRRNLLPGEAEARARAGGLSDRHDTALGDIEGTVGRFGDIYRQVGEAISAPAQRDFNQQSARVGANAASRFGGNVSSEELRQNYNSEDLFARNLSEALARLGGEQVNAGLNYTGQLGGAAAQAAAERDRLRQMILQGFGQVGEKPKSGLGGALGGILGGAVGSFLGPLGTAAGTALGGRL